MKGFTLIELIVSLAIFTLITSMVLYNYRGFNNDIVVSNLAYEVALEIRTAQVYGLSVLGSNNAFDAGYGVHFQTISDNVNDPNFYLFVDSDNNKVLSNFNSTCLSSVDPECLEKVSLQESVAISSFCLVPDNTTDCPANHQGDSLDITFKRPDPDAISTFTFGPSSQPNDYKNARIDLIASDGKTKSIIVDQSGQISVQ